MSDMLVKLYGLPDSKLMMQELEDKGVVIRRAIAPEKHLVSAWVKEHFNDYWVSEVEAAFANRPITCMLAQKDGRLLGFSCHDATYRAFFGPTGVAPEARGLGIGKGLLFTSLLDLASNGYAYAFIGDAGPTEFYRQSVGAVPIEGSTPGIYRGMLTESDLK